MPGPEGAGAMVLCQALKELHIVAKLAGGTY